jgi:hypothetical protein
MGWKDEAVGETVARIKNYLKLLQVWFPTIWQDVTRFINLKASGNPEFQWPNWCFMPVAQAFEIVRQGRDLSNASVEVGQRITLIVSDVGGLAAWRMTQGIYRFHPEVLEAVWETELTDKLPVELLYRMPEWCVYIETSGKLYGQEGARSRLYGFFAFLNYDKKTGGHELRLLLDYGGEPMVLVPVTLYISGHKSIPEMIDGFIETVMKHAPQARVIPSGMEIEEVRKRVTSYGSDMVNSARPCLSLLLYLCSTASDIRESSGTNRLPRRSQPKKVKGGMKFFPPDKPTIWDTGWRIGAMIDRARSAQSVPQGGTHASPVPHIRKPHWHSFWKGPKTDPEKRELVCYWLPPIPVRVKDIEQLVPTIYPVR